MHKHSHLWIYVALWAKQRFDWGWRNVVVHHILIDHFELFEHVGCILKRELEGLQSNIPHTPVLLTKIFITFIFWMMTFSSSKAMFLIWTAKVLWEFWKSLTYCISLFNIRIQIVQLIDSISRELSINSELILKYHKMSETKISSFGKAFISYGSYHFDTV